MKYDVVVVGCGPAGAVAARYAAKEGARTLILDRKREIGKPVRCAEVVAGNLPGDFGMKNESRWLDKKTHYLRLVGPGELEVTIKTTPYTAYVLDRVSFERELAEMAITQGADLLLGKTASGLKRDGVVVQGEVIGSKIVIAADGVDSRIGRQAGIIKRSGGDMMGSCAQHTLVGLDIDPDVLEFYLGSKYAPGGYGWVFPKGNGEANVGVGVLRHGGIAAKEVLERFIKGRFPTSRSVRFVSGCVPSAIPPPECVKGNVVAVGDAARQVNPFTGAGIANAFVAGKIAGQVCGSIAAQDAPLDRLSEYDRLWRCAFERRLWRGLNMRDRILFSDAKIRRFLLLLKILPSFVLKRFLGQLHY